MLLSTQNGLHNGRFGYEGAIDVLKNAGYDGVCVFSYSYIADPLTGKAPERSAKEAENLLSGL